MTKMSRGSQFRADVLATHDLSIAETILLDEIAAVIDQIDVTTDVVETRQQRNLFSRLIAQLNLPDVSGAPAVMSPESSRGKRAADIRWARERAAKQERVS